GRPRPHLSARARADALGRALDRPAPRRMGNAAGSAGGWTQQPRGGAMSVVNAQFSIERNYNCSPSQAFRGFSDPELKRQWFANPAGWPDPIWELDVRVGCGVGGGNGSRDGMRALFRSTFHDIVEDERIVFA